MNVAATQTFRRIDGLVVGGAFALVVLIAFATRLAWRDAAMQRDVGIWAYHGWRMNEGAVLYRDLWENKPPGAFFVFSTVERIAGEAAEFVLFWMDPLLALAVCAAAYWAARGVAGAMPSAIALIPASLMLCHRELTDWGLNSEKFVALFEALALGVILRLSNPSAGASRLRGMLIAGALIGCGAAFKQTGVIILVLAAAHIFWRWRGQSACSARIASLLAGFSLVWAVIIAWLLWRDALGAFWRQVVVFDLVRASSQEQDARFGFTPEHVQFVLNQLWLASPLLLSALVAAALAGRARWRDIALPFAHAAAVCVLFALVPRGYGHYLLQAAPGAAIVLAIGVCQSLKSPRRRARLLALGGAMVIALFSQREFVEFSTNSNYQPRVAYHTMKQVHEHLVDTLKQNTQSTDTVLLWPVDMAASFAARRATPFEICPAIPLFTGRPELLVPPMPVVTRHIQANPPDVIIDWSPVGVSRSGEGGEPVLMTPISGLSLVEPPNEQHARAEGRAVAPLKQWIREHYGGQTRWGDFCTIYRYGQPWRDWKEVLK